MINNKVIEYFFTLTKFLNVKIIVVIINIGGVFLTFSFGEF